MMTDTLQDWQFGGPLDTDMSMDFDYASWNEHTELMLTNVPINSDYRDIVQMDGGLTDWNAWLDSKPNVTLRNASMQKFGEGIVKIDLPMNEAMKYNYLRARNGSSPVTNIQRDYYYFITGVRYGAPNTTYLSIQVDVVTTFLPEVKFGQCYLERGHYGIANEKQMDAFGREYLTVPEGLDLGGEYRTVHVEFEKIMSSVSFTDTNNTGLGYDVLVCSTLDLTQDPGDVSNPSLQSATGGLFQGLPSGASFYLFPTGVDLLNFFKSYSSKPWITQSIISITLIPNMKRYVPDYDYGTNLSTDSSFKFYAAKADNPGAHTKKNLTNWRNADFIENILGPEYKILKKFLTYPYMIVELTTFTGSPLVIKPESWQDPDATIVEMAALMPPGQRIAVMPARYNWDAETDTTRTGATQHVYETGYAFEDFGEFLDFAAWISDFPQLPVVNNSAIAFLANNKNSLAFSQSSAQWTEQRALSGASAAYDVQNAQIGNTARQSAIGNDANTQQAALGAMTGVQNSIIGAAGAIPDMALGAGEAGMALGGKRSGAPGLGVSAGRAMGGVGTQAGGLGSAAAGMLQAGNSANASLQAAQIANTARGNSAVSDIQTAGSVRDTNNAFATMAAKGDYANAIAGIKARVQDARMLQPSTSGQFGGDAFNLVNGKFGYSLRWKMANLNALRSLGQYWLRYGYAINQYVQMPASLHCMSKFTYWKLSETYLSQGAFPEGFKQVLRGVFEKGVTVWKNPDDIGNTPLSANQPLEGISY
jgi:hypothetical protein